MKALRILLVRFTWVRVITVGGRPNRTTQILTPEIVFSFFLADTS